MPGPEETAPAQGHGQPTLDTITAPAAVLAGNEQFESSTPPIATSEQPEAEQPQPNSPVNAEVRQASPEQSVDHSLFSEMPSKHQQVDATALSVNGLIKSCPHYRARYQADPDATKAEATQVVSKAQDVDTMRKQGKSDVEIKAILDADDLAWAKNMAKTVQKDAKPAPPITEVTPATPAKHSDGLEDVARSQLLLHPERTSVDVENKVSRTYPNLSELVVTTKAVEELSLAQRQADESSSQKAIRHLQDVAGLGEAPVEALKVIELTHTDTAAQSEQVTPVVEASSVLIDLDSLQSDMRTLVEDSLEELNMIAPDIATPVETQVSVSVDKMYSRPETMLDLYATEPLISDAERIEFSDEFDADAPEDKLEPSALPSELGADDTAFYEATSQDEATEAMARPGLETANDFISNTEAALEAAEAAGLPAALANAVQEFVARLSVEELPHGLGPTEHGAAVLEHGVEAIIEHQLSIDQIDQVALVKILVEVMAAVQADTDSHLQLQFIELLQSDDLAGILGLLPVEETNVSQLSKRIGTSEFVIKLKQALVSLQATTHRVYQIGKSILKVYQSQFVAQL